eukprot:CAMPEP_0170302356 /NCGR_PEP_ID=MMETSP0116_2-20130129/51461_1 /TAXON_ID=400756 /ORGANISM="Durinskia baltica, Strain CSIRO CS-38" /LENGTH=134 /DNA_ID=CAMNT_0010554225 /DNA_START=15 /DNA_END=417 /DNA_ORIENTATION=+
MNETALDEVAPRLPCAQGHVLVVLRQPTLLVLRLPFACLELRERVELMLRLAAGLPAKVRRRRQGRQTTAATARAAGGAARLAPEGVARLRGRQQEAARRRPFRRLQWGAAAAAEADGAMRPTFRCPKRRCALA